MKKSVLNWIGQAVAVVAISAAASTAALAQSVDQEFARELKLVEGLKVYNKQLEDQLKAQNVARREIQASIGKAKDLEPHQVVFAVSWISIRLRWNTAITMKLIRQCKM